MIKGKAVYDVANPTTDKVTRSYDLGYYKTISGAKRILGKFLKHSNAIRVELWSGNDLIARKNKDENWIMQTIKGNDNGENIS